MTSTHNEPVIQSADKIVAKSSVCGNLSMPEVVQAIEAEISQQGGRVQEDKNALITLMDRFSGEDVEFADYQYCDSEANYTRNLVASDGATYALICLVWKEGAHSPVHDHPGDGCWMSVLRGGLRETHYEKAHADHCCSCG